MLTLDKRDWYEQGQDPKQVLEKVTEMLWEFGLDKDVKLVASPRLYKLVTETDTMKLEK